MAIVSIWYISPLITLVMGLFVYTAFYGRKYAKDLAVLFQLSALLLNTVLLYTFRGEYHFASIDITGDFYFFNEMVLFGFLAVLFVDKRKVVDPRSDDMFILILLFTQLGFAGIFLSANLILILIFLLIELTGLTLLFHFGKYRREYFIIRRYMIIIMIFAVIYTVFLNFVYITTGTISLYEIESGAATVPAGFGIRVFLFITPVVMLGLPCALLTLLPKKEFFEAGNFPSIFLMTSLQYPLYIALCFRILNTFGLIGTSVANEIVPIYAGMVLLLVSLFGVVYNTLFGLTELFRGFKRNSSNFGLIFGAIGSVKFDVMLMMVALSVIIYPENLSIDYMRAALFNVFVLFFFTDLSIFSLIAPIFDERMLSDIVGKPAPIEYRNFIYGLAVPVIVITAPFLPGYFLTDLMFDITGKGIKPVYIAKTLGAAVLSSYIGFLAIFMVIMAFCGVFMFVPRKKVKEITVSKADRRDLIPLAVSILYPFILLSIVFLTPDPSGFVSYLMSYLIK